MFRRYLDPLVAVMTDKDQQTPFTIGIFGPWGSGKSTLLRMLGEDLVDRFGSQFVTVEFNAWIHRGESNILVPLLHTLHDALAADTEKRFVESVERIGSVLLNLGADLLLKAVTAGQVSLEKLEELEKKYLERRFRVESEMRNLRKTLEDEAKKIHAAGANLVVLVDDLDRCDPDQIDTLPDVHVMRLAPLKAAEIKRVIEMRWGTTTALPFHTQTFCDFCAKNQHTVGVVLRVADELIKKRVEKYELISAGTVVGPGTWPADTDLGIGTSIDTPRARHSVVESRPIPGRSWYTNRPCPRSRRLFASSHRSSVPALARATT
jgi:Cdc6-like AAA superfamily ATPase